MKYSEFEFCLDDGTALYAREWQPENELRGVVCLIHGLGEHSGRYVNLALALNKAGYVLLTYDQRGHGKSMGQRGHISAYELLLDDIESFRLESKQRFPNLPIFLYGHSLGGNLVLNYILRRHPLFAGVIATGPWLQLTIPPSQLLKSGAALLNKFWPNFSIVSGLDVQALSHDPIVVEAYQIDPLVHNRISVRLFTAMDQAGQWAMNHAVLFDLPLLLMHGEEDRITSPIATEQFASLVQRDCTLKLWPGLYHELHQESEKEAVMTFLIHWLELHNP